MYVIGLRIVQAIQISMYQQISINAQCVAPAAAKHSKSAMNSHMHKLSEPQL